MPIRVQRRRTKGWAMPDGAVSVTRPSEFGNPYRVVRRKNDPAYEWWVENELGVWMFNTKADAVAASVRMYRQWISHPQNQKLRARARLALHGKDLACFCPVGQPCHGDVLLSISNE